jgi:hypothetical protein
MVDVVSVEELRAMHVPRLLAMHASCLWDLSTAVERDNELWRARTRLYHLLHQELASELPRRECVRTLVDIITENDNEQNAQDNSCKNLKETFANVKQVIYEHGLSP